MAQSSDSILIVDDDEDILIAAKLLLKRHYAHIDTCSKPEKIPTLMAENDYATILLDMNFSPGESDGQQGFLWLQKILLVDPDAVVVLITAHGGVDVAVEAMKIGATDFISKPWQNEKFIATVSASVKLKQSRSQARQLRLTNKELVEAAKGQRQPMLGKSKSWQVVLNMIARAAPTEANVLLLGENGTGKELVAQELHRQSNRKDKAFISVDLGAITGSLFESELFGHKKGAFTDASSDRVGRVQAAEGGTLFLDEIGNLPLHLQAKLLSVLEQRQVSPVGSSKVIDIDVRIIAATNLTKEQLDDEHRFRQDLLFRLNTIEILLPALRQRSTDIPDIATFFANLYCRKYGHPSKQFSTTAMQALVEYPWPGNIRALRHAVERAVILSENAQFELADFQIEQTSEKSTKAHQLSTKDSDDLNLERIEKRTISEALVRNHYNISHASKELGLTRAALYRRMEKHGL